MGLLNFRKKKEELPLPPPPPRPQQLPSDIEPIGGTHEDFVELPELPNLNDFPEMPELPEVPAPAEIRPMPSIEAPIGEKEASVFDRTLLPEMEEPPVRKPPAKSFVAVSDYKHILDESNVVRTKIMEAETLLKQLKDVREHEEKLFSRWQSHIENIEKKLTHVDQVISKAKR